MLAKLVPRHELAAKPCTIYANTLPFGIMRESGKFGRDKLLRRSASNTLAFREKQENMDWHGTCKVLAKLVPRHELAAKPCTSYANLKTETWKPGIAPGDTGSTSKLHSHCKNKWHAPC